MEILGSDRKSTQILQSWDSLIGLLHLCVLVRLLRAQPGAKENTCRGLQLSANIFPYIEIRIGIHPITMN